MNALIIVAIIIGVHAIVMCLLAGVLVREIRANAASASKGEPAEPQPIIGYWYDPYAYETVRFFARRTEPPNPGEAIPGKEGTDWGVLRGVKADELLPATPSVPADWTVHRGARTDNATTSPTDKAY